jgi:tetratricopeptide (TPR) repeat protein
MGPWVRLLGTWYYILAYTWMTIAAMAKNRAGLFDQAIAWCRRAIEANRTFSQPHLELAVALSQQGCLDEARTAAAIGLAISPSFTVSRLRASWTAMSDEPAYLAAIESQFEALRMAGVPE